MKHDEMLEQIDYLTESIDIEMEEGEEEIVSNIQQLLVQGNIKPIISPQQVMNDLLLEKNYNITVVDSFINSSSLSIDKVKK